MTTSHNVEFTSELFAETWQWSCDCGAAGKDCSSMDAAVKDCSKHIEEVQKETPWKSGDPCGSCGSTNTVMTIDDGPSCLDCKRTDMDG